MNKYSKIIAGVLALALILFILSLGILPVSKAANIVGTNYKNVTVQTFVNITHSKPDVLNVTIYEALNFSAKNITVNAGSTKTIYCNATLRNWQGYNDITSVNATLWHVATSSNNASDSFANHYTNSSCILNSSLSAVTAWYVCSFDVHYYANNGTWLCNVTVSNSYTATNSNFTGSGFATTTFYPVYALNVTDGIDYGGVAVEDYSNPDRTANVSNLGNMNINITVEGYGVKRNDGLAMNCTLSGNITVDNERFSSVSSQAYNLKTALTSIAGGVSIPALTLPKQSNSTPIINSTYWQLYIPPNPAGNCTGYVIFTAIVP